MEDRAVIKYSFLKGKMPTRFKFSSDFQIKKNVFIVSFEMHRMNIISLFDDIRKKHSCRSTFEINTILAYYVSRMERLERFTQTLAQFYC